MSDEKMEKEIKDLRKELFEMKVQVGRLEENYNTTINNINDTLLEIKNDLKDLKEKPANRWELIISGIITSAVGFVIAIVLKGGF